MAPCVPPTQPAGPLLMSDGWTLPAIWAVNERIISWSTHANGARYSELMLFLIIEPLDPFNIEFWLGNFVICWVTCDYGNSISFWLYRAPHFDRQYKKARVIYNIGINILVITLITNMLNSVSLIMPMLIISKYVIWYDLSNSRRVTFIWIKMKCT